jgi:hypothetical protein
MIPSPNLDDRTFEDIVQEAIRLIPQYCPEWTNHNRADPGVTLIELFAWMTEMTLYRLNRVPEKNFLAFLDLMGITLTPPQPARTVAQFGVKADADPVLVPRGTRIGTRPDPEGRYVTFETETDLTVVDTMLAACWSQHHDEAENNMKAGLGDRSPDAPGISIWKGARSVDRYLYLGDKRLESFTEGSILTVRATIPARDGRPFVRMLEWEYWDGKRWRELLNPAIEVEEDQIAFLGPPAIAACKVDEKSNVWLRGRLGEVPSNSNETLVDQLLMRLEVVGEGERPEHALANIESGVFLALDIDRNFLPFGREPRIDSSFYVACDRVLTHPDATIRIDVDLSDPLTVPRPQPSPDLVVAWEYWNGKRWRLLGRNGLGEFDVEDAGFEFGDETVALTQSGYVTFKRPKDLAGTVVNGVEGHFIRARVERGDYGVSGTYELDGDRWVWRDERPLRPPSLKSVSLRFVEIEHGFEQVMAYNDFVYTDYTDVASKELKAFQPFQPVAEDSPTLYLGFTNGFPNERVQLYFELAEAAGGRRVTARPGDTTAVLTEKHSEQTITWEYWNGRIWANLLPRDGTIGFSQSGFLEFVGPRDLRKTKRYGEERFWLRARLEFGGYDEPPRLRAILLNSVYASNVNTFGETVLGSSQGTPNQIFRFVRGPVLPGQEI